MQPWRYPEPSTQTISRHTPIHISGKELSSERFGATLGDLASTIKTSGLGMRKCYLAYNI